MGPRITTLAVGVGAVVAGGAIAFALAVGVGAVTLPNAGQQAAVPANFVSDSSSGTQGWDRGPGMHGGWGYGPLQALVADNTITAQQAAAIMQAVRTQHEKTEATGGTQSPTTFQQDVKTALDSLVAAGTITSAQAAKVSTALSTMPGPGFEGRGPGMRGGFGYGPLQALVADNTITGQQAAAIVQAFRAALPTDGTRPDAAALQAALKTALDKLVAAGTITSAQAAKVTTAFGSFEGGPGVGPGWGMHDGYGPLQALVADNTITAQQAAAIMQAVRTQHEKTETTGGTQSPTTFQQDVKTALDSLVAAGTITSAQAAKVSTALSTMPGPGFEGRGPGMRGGMHGGWGAGPNGSGPGTSPAPTTGSGTTS